MEISGQTTLKDIQERKHEDASHFLHEHLCKKGKGHFCCARELTLREAAKESGTELDFLITKLKRIPNRSN